MFLNTNQLILRGLLFGYYDFLKVESLRLSVSFVKPSSIVIAQFPIKLCYIYGAI